MADGSLPHPMVAGRGGEAKPIAVVGPNAITRVAEALNTLIGREASARVFGHADLLRHLAEPPTRMVDEREVARLHASLFAVLGPTGARRIARDAGRRTGDYLIERRIPRAIGLLLRCLPAALAAQILAKAISRHAWTFAGSGTLTVVPGPPLVFRIEQCPLCREIEADSPACDYYAATFERLFEVLVSRHAVVTETACAAAGALACVFEVSWRRQI